MSVAKRRNLLGVVILLSLLCPLIAGGYYLWNHGYLLWYFAALALLMLACWGGAKVLTKCHGQPKWLDLPESIIRTPQSAQAWQRVEAISSATRASDPDLRKPDFYLQTLTQVTKEVAEVYYPAQKQAQLEVKVPELLKVIEMLARELRLNFIQHTAGNQLLSIDVLKFATERRALYRLFSIVSAGIDPISTVSRGLSLFANANLLFGSGDQLKQWLIDAYVKKIAYYAIELYSGNLSLDEEALRKPSRHTQREIDDILKRQQAKENKP